MDMEPRKLLRGALVLEIALLAGILTMIYLMPVSEASYFKLHELLGGVSASILTTFGLFKMKQLT